MDNRSTPHRARRPLLRLPVAAVVAAFTVLAAFQTYRSANIDTQVRFARRSESVAGSLSFRMRAYGRVLSELAGFFEAGAAPKRAVFAEVARRVEASLPGVLAVGYAEAVPADGLRAHEAGVRAEGLLDYRVNPPGERAHYAPIAMIEPLDAQNKGVLGFDMLSDPVRRELLERSRDAGVPVMSQRVVLLQQHRGRRQPGFLFFAPIYRHGASTSSLAGRQSGLQGWLYTAFRADDLVAHALDDLRDKEVSVELFDGAPGPSALLYASPPEEPQSVLLHPPPHLHAQAEIPVLGRTWTILTHEATERGIDPLYQALAVLLSGGAISVLISRNAREALRHEAQQRLLLEKEQAARLEAQRAVRSRDDVLAVVSHDLRNPLNAVLLSGQVLGKLVDTTALPEAERRTASRAVLGLLRSAERMRLLLGDLLDLARIETGGLSVEAQACEVESLVREALDLQAPMAEQHQLRLTAAIEPGLPGLWCDRSRVLQIFANLIGNALKFTPPGGAVEVAARSSGDLIELSVKDDGPGIPPQQLPHVFERHWQAQRTGSHGVGLGLFIARSLVEAQGGRIKAESDPGRGATFRFSLPIAPKAPGSCS